MISLIVLAPIYYLFYTMKKVALFVFLALLITACSRTPGTFDSLANCLTEKDVKMYGTDTCPYCKEQKASFKGSFDLLNYVNCEKQPAECQKNDISGYPTWEINGKFYPGKKSLSEIADLAGCEVSD